MKTFDRYPYLKHSTAENMTFKPAHKEATTAPGQVRHEDKGLSSLSEYIGSIKRAEAFDQVAQEQKLTFKQAVGPIADKFFEYNPSVDLDDYDDVLLWELIWNAALKHGKVS